MTRKLVAAIACRSQGSRLYGKPMQNLDVSSGIRILDNILDCLATVPCIDESVLGISDGKENVVYSDLAMARGMRWVFGDELDVLGRLITCGEAAEATDIFRVTSESPFPLFEQIQVAWELHLRENSDAVFLDNVVDGCGFEIITLDALRRSHAEGEDRHRSELCTLYLRENTDNFKILRQESSKSLARKDLRLTVDNPEDLVLCRAVYGALGDMAPRIPVSQIVEFLDSRPDLVNLTAPFTEVGYQNMYVWGKNNE